MAQHIVYNFEDPGVEKPRRSYDRVMAKPNEPYTEGGSYTNGTDCDNLTVSITNPDNGKTWTAETSGNNYRIMLTSIDLNATDVLRSDAICVVYSSVTDHNVTTDEVSDGGLFEFNITPDRDRVMSMAMST